MYRSTSVRRKNLLGPILYNIQAPHVSFCNINAEWELVWKLTSLVLPKWADNQPNLGDVKMRNLHKLSHVRFCAGNDDILVAWSDLRRRPKKRRGPGHRPPTMIGQPQKLGFSFFRGDVEKSEVFI